MSREFEFQPPKLPDAIEEQYHLLSVLSWRKKSRVFLVASKEDGGKYIIKYGRGQRAAFLKNEYDILSKRTYQFIPACMGILEEEGSVWLIREYIEGENLSGSIEDGDRLTLAEAICYMEKICDCISVFHEENPPLLHRDIKPENIIVRPDGSVAFIDLDTARRFDEGKEKDTIYVGTRLTAAPEQFGYQQTSVRTDIYSLGILFLFLLTGDYSNSGRAFKSLPSEVKKDRYPGVGALKKELICLKRFGMRRRIAVSLAAGCLGIALLCGFGAYSGIRQYRYVHESVAFTEPLVERAVRESLLKDEKEIITKQELSRVTTLIICHDEIFPDMQSHQRYHDEQWFEFEEGGERLESIDTSDLKSLTGLKYLVLDDCGLDDISDLCDIDLVSLSVRKNHIGDIQALKGMDSLKELVIDSNPVADISVLSSCSNLENLRIQNTYVSDLSPLQGLPIVYLDLTGTPVEDKSVVASLTRLKKFYADHMSDSDVESLRDIKGLEWIGIFDSSIDDMSTFDDQDQLVNIDLSYCENINDIHWVMRHTGLDYLGLAHTGVRDISDVSACRMLTHLDLSGTPVKDLGVLQNLPRLEVLYIDSAKEGVIANASLPDTIEVIVTE